MCNVGVEKPDHLFMNCNFARQVWATFPEINPTDTSNVVSLLEWLHSLDCNGNENLSKLSLALLICSKIWKERNQVVLRNGKAIPGRVVMLAMSLGDDFMNANESNKETSKSHRFIGWNPPRRGFLKINFDGSVVNSKATAGFVIRNEDGDLTAVVLGAWVKIQYLLLKLKA